MIFRENYSDDGCFLLDFSDLQTYNAGSLNSGAVWTTPSMRATRDFSSRDHFRRLIPHPAPLLRALSIQPTTSEMSVAA